MNHLLLLLLLFFLPFTYSSCSSDLTILSSAFASVSNFHPPQCPPSQNLTTLHLPSRNLTGTVSWNLLFTLPFLRFIDLSNNSLVGSLPSSFWSSPSLRHVSLAHNRLGGSLRFALSPSLTLLNLSHNRFTAVVFLSHLSSLRHLDLSRNELTSLPPGLDTLYNLVYLDLSYNSISGDFSRDFPEFKELKFLNVSYNRFYGNVDDDKVKKFGMSAFIKAGSLTFSKAKNSKKKRRRLLLLLVVGVSIVIVAIFGMVGWVVKRRRGRGKGWKEEERGVKAAEEVPAWVAEARWAAQVVVFEKPLLELKFSDIAAATSGFGKESMLAEGGRSGPAYRAVLPGDMDVVVRVVTGAREVGEGEAAAGFREMAKLRHPNLLPLLGYCIAGITLT